MNILSTFDPVLIIFGLPALLLSPFSWVFLLLSFVVFFVVRYFRTTTYAELTVGLFWVVFWASQLLSEQGAVREFYACGRTQGSMEGMCEVVSSAGFPFIALHYFPAGDMPHIGMWPLFFANAAICALVTAIVVQFLPKQVVENKYLRLSVFVFGLVMMVIGQGAIMLHFD